MNDLLERAQALKLYGLIAHMEEVQDQPWLNDLLGWEEHERARRGLERRMRRARLGAFKTLADFDWTWPTKIDRTQIDDLFRLEWLHTPTNVILVGPNGVGKTMLVKNLLHQAVLAGVTARFLTASELLNTLVEQQSGASLKRKLALFTRPHLLAIDEIGYLAYDARHADLLFEIVARRYEKRPTIITTNKPFAEWGEVFPNATCVVTIVDRLVHRSEVVSIEGSSYRLKESKENAKKRARSRATRRRKRPAKAS